MKYSSKQILPWCMVSLGLLFYAYESMLRVSPSVMSMELMQNFHISATQLSNLTAFYYYIYAPMQFAVGILMDRYGPRKLLSLAALLCAIGTYLFSSTQDLHVAELGRFLVGFGSAFAFVGVLKLATIWLPPERFAIVSGTTMALGMVGGVLCDLSMPALMRFEGWRVALYHSALFGLILVGLLVFVLRDGAKHSPRDFKLADSYREAFKNLFTLICNKQIWLNGLVGCLMWLPISIYAETWGVNYLNQVHHIDHTTAAHINAFVFWGWAVGGPLVGFLSDRIRRRVLPMAVGSLGACLCFVIMMTMHVPVWSLAPLLFLCGLFNSAQVIVFAVSRENTTAIAAGTAAALTNLFTMISGIIQPVSGFLMDLADGSHHVSGTINYSTHAYNMALCLIPIGLFLSFIVCLFLKETHCREQGSQKIMSALGSH